MLRTLCIIITFISAAVSFGFSVDAFLKGRKTGGEAFTNAKYAASRSLALLLAAVGCFFASSNDYLIALAVAMIGVQLFDGIIGFKISTFKTFGPLLTSVANLVVLVLLIMYSK